jgi:DNA-binding MarR family transcriptional regulator
MRAMADGSAYRPSGIVRSQPSWLISRLATLARRLVDEALAGEDVRRAHFSVLGVLEEDGAASQADLGRRLWIDRSDMHGLLEDLELQGLVERRRDDGDRRRNVVQITARGRRALLRMERAVEGAQAELLRPLGAAERRELVRLLDALVRAQA